MIEVIDNPYDYEKPEWLTEKERQIRRDKSMTNVQRMLLLEMGKGNLADGVNALIKEYL